MSTHQDKQRARLRRMRVVVLAAAATASVVATFLVSYERIEHYHETSEQLLACGRHASALHTLQWRVLAERDLTDETAERVRVTRLEFLDTRRLVTEDANDPFLSRLTEAYESYVAAVDRTRLLIAAGDLDRATEEQQSVVEPAYARLIGVVAKAQANTRARELRNLSIVQVGSFCVLIFGVLATVAISFRMFASVERSAERSRALNEHASDLLWIIDSMGRVIYSTPSVSQTLTVDTSSGNTDMLWDVVHPDDLERTRSFVASLTQQPGTLHTFEGRFRGRVDEELQLEVFGRDLLHNPSVRGIVLNGRNITERKQHEATLLREALHDHLTQLPNRVLLADRIAAALAACGHDPDATFAVLFIDLDGFKAINDAMGHAAGDELLKAVAARLSSTVRLIGGVNRPIEPRGIRRPPGTDTLARVGGDEFVVLLNYTRSATNALEAANRLLAELNRPFVVGGQDVFVSASIGVTTGPGRYTSVDELLRDADTAMYRAKASGRSQVQMFDPAMQASARRSLSLKAQMRKALEQEEFTLLYQPVVELGSGQLRGCEGLVRWQHEEGTIQPSEFISLAEETGLIVPLGRWAMLQACRQLRAWRREFPDLPAGFVSINISAIELAHPEFIAHVDRTVTSIGIAPSDLRFELTESVAMQEPARAIEVIHALRARGHQIAMDDFGTGHCSLSYFHRLPADVLKIDQSFVHDLENSSRALSAVKLIIDMARLGGMEVIAEGVETEEQAAQLFSAGCRLAQGYAIARPLKAGALRKQFLLGIARAPSWSSRQAG